MHRSKVFISCCLLIMFCTPAAAFNIQKGIHGMNWGSSISEYKDLAKVHEAGQAAYFANLNMSYRTANQPIPGVLYGFYKDQFFAVFIKLRSPDQFSHLERQFSRKYGIPQIKNHASAGQKVYRWKDADVKIKLKLKESPGEYKMAIYYAPLAAKLNQENFEKVPEAVLESTPHKKDKTMKSAPLLNF